MLISLVIKVEVKGCFKKILPQWEVKECVYKHVRSGKIVFGSGNGGSSNTDLLQRGIKELERNDNRDSRGFDISSGGTGVESLLLEVNKKSSLPLDLYTD